MIQNLRILLRIHLHHCFLFRILRRSLAWHIWVDPNPILRWILWRLTIFLLGQWVLYVRISGSSLLVWCYTLDNHSLLIFPEQIPLYSCLVWCMQLSPLFPSLYLPINCAETKKKEKMSKLVNCKICQQTKFTHLWQIIIISKFCCLAKLFFK